MSRILSVGVSMGVCFSAEFVGRPHTVDVPCKMPASADRSVTAQPYGVPRSNAVMRMRG
jgi:hypothetical protein